jgi:hypothetical protein
MCVPAFISAQTIPARLRVTAMSDTLMMAAAPEVGVPMEVAKQLAPHAPTLLMGLLVVLALIMIIIGVIIESAATNKTPGIMLMIVGFLLGGGAFFIMYRTESNRKKQA